MLFIDFLVESNIEKAGNVAINLFNVSGGMPALDISHIILYGSKVTFNVFQVAFLAGWLCLVQAL